MATDIWIHLEYKSRKTKKYKYAGEFNVLRNYDMFSLLAGVTHYHKPLYTPRGLPGGVCECIYKEYKESVLNFHTPSWLSTIEYRECLDAADEIEKRECKQDGREYDPTWLESYNLIYDYMRTLDEVGDYARIVFWFHT